MNNIFLSILITGIALLHPICIHAQEETFSFKDWEKNNKLIVADFKGQPDSNSSSISSMVVEISPYELSISADSEILLVVVRFDKLGSWTKAKDHPERFLTYEQKSFDIGEVYARMIRKELLTQHYTSDNSIATDKLKNKYEDTLCYNEIREYDEETMGGRDSLEEKKWDGKIKRELDSLAAYSNPIVIIKFYKN